MRDIYDYADDAIRRDMFEHPGSALRQATKRNPRCIACPTCGEPNRLTLADQRLGYQCDDCANRDERGW